jgi:hypothetical protein
LTYPTRLLRVAGRRGDPDRAHNERWKETPAMRRHASLLTILGLLALTAVALPSKGGKITLKLA